MVGDTSTRSSVKAITDIDAAGPDRVTGVLQRPASCGSQRLLERDRIPPLRTNSAKRSARVRDARSYQFGLGSRGCHGPPGVREPADGSVRTARWLSTRIHQLDAGLSASRTAARPPGRQSCIRRSGFTRTLAALFFAVVVFGGIVPFLLLGLAVVVAGAFVLRRGVRLGVETAGSRAPRDVTYYLLSLVWKPAGEPEYAQMSERRP